MVNTTRLAVWLEAHRCDLCVFDDTKKRHTNRIDFFIQRKNRWKKAYIFACRLKHDIWNCIHGQMSAEKKRVMPQKQQTSTGCWRFCDVISNAKQEHAQKPGCVDVMRMERERKKETKQKREKTTRMRNLLSKLSKLFANRLCLLKTT